MINSIIYGIANALDSNFNCDIFTENIKQGFDGPCFFIKSLNTDDNIVLNNRRIASYSFCIHYFPESSSDNYNSSDVAQTLYQCLEYINLDNVSTNKIRANEMNHEVLDGILLFNISFNVYYKRSLGSVTNMRLIESNNSSVD